MAFGWFWLLSAGVLAQNQHSQHLAPWSAGSVVNLGARLASAYIALPGEVILAGSREIELTAPVEITAERISFRAPSMALKVQNAPGSDQPLPESERSVLVEADEVFSDVATLSGAGVDLTIAVNSKGTLHYPLIQHAKNRATPPQDADLREKYLRLRKILTHFRSHSKGALAKYSEKIENPRVAGNRVGSAVLSRLVQDGVLTMQGPIYFLDPDRVDSLLGTSWNDLRKGVISTKLLQYLQSISL